MVHTLVWEAPWRKSVANSKRMMFSNSIIYGTKRRVTTPGQVHMASGTPPS